LLNKKKWLSKWLVEVYYIDKKRDSLFERKSNYPSNCLFRQGIKYSEDTILDTLSAVNSIRKQIKSDFVSLLEQLREDG
jgi:hypothetical protein